MIDPKLLADHNLTPAEYDRIVELVGREPNITELGIFSTMWSEHCSYKSSKVFLKRLPTKGKHVIQGPGENAGIIDIGGGLAVVFKIESHNHPSYLEPFQGAATGVGGILRDIFTMGARPIAILDSLRFGPLDDPRNRAIMEGVVSGISSYGNSIGVPTVGGEVDFHEGYARNPLVNVFCLGLARKDKIFYAKAEGIGNPVLYVGSKTGRDGIHGATMASAEFGKETEQKRPNVQVGDPFKEKLLLEACLEVMDRGLIIGIQDMGAAGLTCSTTEMAAKSGNGIAINLDLVPQREEGMTPYEIMLSESQERMLLVCSREKMAEVQRVFAKWDLDAVNIGEVTAGGQVRVTWHGETVVDVPVSAVVDLCPAYTRPGRRPESLPEPAGAAEPPAVPSDLGARSPQDHGGPDPGRQALGLPPVRPHGADEYRSSARRGRRGPAHQGPEEGAGHDARRQFPILSDRPPGRRPDRGRRGLPQPGLRRRPAGGGHQLPEFRQSGKARGHVAVRRGRRGPVGGLPGLRHPGHGRQRQLVQ